MMMLTRAAHSMAATDEPDVMLLWARIATVTGFEVSVAAAIARVSVCG